jgi:hypothetical protein
MATRSQVQALLDEGHSYETAARELGLSAGATFMLATGIPADGSDALTTEQAAALPASTQHLLGVPALNPTTDPHVLPWVRERAARELTRPS